VTQEGPDRLSHYCLVPAIGFGESLSITSFKNRELKMDDNHHGIVGGVDTHKDIHFAAVVDTYDRVFASILSPQHGKVTNQC
jgi:hypothetical protein